MSLGNSDSNKSNEGDTSHNSNITTKENSENKILHKCCIYFLYHFDLGSRYLEDGIDKNEFERYEYLIKEKIENLKKVEHITHYDHLTIKTPSNFRTGNPENYRIGIGNLHIELKLLDQNKPLPSPDGYKLKLAKAHIILFDTGVATVSLKFDLNFEKEPNPKGVHEAYGNIYCKIKESLNENGTNNKKDSEELTIFKEIHDIIEDIRGQLPGGPRSLYLKGDESSLSPMPLFWIPKMEWAKAKQFFSLLYLKPKLDPEILDWKMETNDQLKEVKSSYCSSDENHFICTWSAALLIDDDMKNIETYLGLLELSSYIYLAAYLLVDALEDIIKDNNNFKVGIEEKQIEKITKLRSRSYYIQQIKYTSLLSLWGNSVEIFDKILEDAWQTEKTLYAKIHEQAEFLNSMFQYMYEDKQNKLNLKISNGLSLLQAMSVPLILFITLLAITNESSICTITSVPNVNTTNNSTAANAANWCENNDAFLRIMIILLVLSIPGCLIWYKKSLELQVNAIK